MVDWRWAVSSTRIIDICVHIVWNIPLAYGLHVWNVSAYTVLVGYVTSGLIMGLLLFNSSVARYRGDSKWGPLLECLELLVCCMGVCYALEYNLAAYSYGMLCGVIFMFSPNASVIAVRNTKGGDGRMEMLKPQRTISFHTIEMLWETMVRNEDVFKIGRGHGVQSD